MLWHATSLAKANAQRIADERDDTLISIDKLERHRKPHLPAELILSIADYLRWEQQYDERLDLDCVDYSSLRTMADAFSAIEGMEEALLRKVPLVLFTAQTTKQEKERILWEKIFRDMPASRREVIGTSPRFCYIDNSKAISHIHPREEVHLVLATDRHITPQASQSLLKCLGDVHLTVLCYRHLYNGFQRNPSKIFNSTFLSRTSSITLEIVDMPWNRANESTPLSLDFIEKSSSAPKQINIPFSSVGTDLLSLAPYLIFLEFNSTNVITMESLAKLSKTLYPIRLSLQSLRLSCQPTPWGSTLR